MEMQLTFQNQYGNRIGSTPTHLFLSPHPLLRPYIAHYTLMLPGRAAASPVLNLVPDVSGCFVFTFDSSSMESRLYGATTRMVTVSNDTDEHMVRLFVEFVPGGLAQFAGLGQRELTDRVVPVEDLCPQISTAVEDTFDGDGNLDDWIRRIDGVMLRALRPRDPTAAFAAAVDTLKQAGGAVPVNRVSSEVGYSERHLNRLFFDYIGMNIKTFSKILRINETIRQIQQGQSNLTMLAQNSGFYDQSHLIRDFQSICGVTPGEYLQSLSVFYNEPIKLTV